MTRLECTCDMGYGRESNFSPDCPIDGHRDAYYARKTPPRKECMSEYPIPNDLQELYNSQNAYGIAQYKGGDWPQDWSHKHLASLIERIARLEAQDKALCEALEAVAQRKLKDGTLCWCGMGYSVEDTHYPFCKKARAAIAQAKEQG